MIINCIEKENEVLDEVIKFSKDRHIVMAVIQIGDDNASNIYIKNKKKKAQQCNIECIHCKLKESSSFDDISKIIKGFNEDIQVNGIILQLPLPEHLKKYEQELLDLIDWKKDIDGLTTNNVGRLWSNKECLKPATALGIMSLLPNDLSNLVVAIINRSKLIGKPLVKMLEERNATPILCHTKTDKTFLFSTLKRAEIIITATGRPKWLDHDTVAIMSRYFDVCCSKYIIDAGICKDKNNKLCGDVDVDTFANSDVNVTPTPKGTGLLTVAYLLSNVCKAYELQHKGEI